MPDLPSRIDLLSIGTDYMVQRATKIDHRQPLITGSDANLFVGAGAAMAHAVVLHLAYATARLMLDGARGEDLDRYVLDRYRLPRKGAAAALVTLRFYRDAGGSNGDVVAGRKIKTKSGVEYTTIQTASFSTSTLVQEVDARAAEAGKASQVGANTLRQFENTSDLFDPSLKVNNDAKAAGGEDIEDDETYRERARGFWAAARRGTLGAIEFGAVQVDGVVSAQAVEALNGSAQPARFVYLYISDSSGVANAALAHAVQIQLFDFRGAGVYVQVVPSIPSIADVALKLTFASNVDTNALGENVRAAVVEYVNSLPVNAPLTRSALGAVLERYRSDGLIPNNGSIVTPAGDIVPSAGQTLRTTLDHVRLT